MIYKFDEVVSTFPKQFTRKSEISPISSQLNLILNTSPASVINVTDSILHTK